MPAENVIRMTKKQGTYQTEGNNEEISSSSPSSSSMIQSATSVMFSSSTLAALAIGFAVGLFAGFYVGRK